MKISAVKCDLCGRLHEENSNTYFTIYGNVYLGMNEVLIENILDKNRFDSSVLIFCKPHCMMKVLDIEINGAR